MPVVHIPAHMRSACDGRETVQVSGSTLRQVIDSLDEACPGMKALLVEGGRVRGEIAVAIGSTITDNGMLEPVPEDAEVHLIPAIAGG